MDIYGESLTLCKGSGISGCHGMLISAKMGVEFSTEKKDCAAVNKLAFVSVMSNLFLLDCTDGVKCSPTSQADGYRVSAS